MTTNDSAEADSDFDCVEFKRRAQAEIHAEIKGMTHEEEIAYFRKRADEGWIGEWWRSIQHGPPTVHEKPPERTEDTE
jgi:hypothetical protein